MEYLIKLSYNNSRRKLNSSLTRTLVLLTRKYKHWELNSQQIVKNRPALQINVYFMRSTGFLEAYFIENDCFCAA